MRDVAADRPRILAPPPVIYLGVLGLGLLLEWLWPTRLLGWPLAVAVGSTIFICGVVGLTVAIRTVLRARTPVDPYKATTAIVTGGLFQFSRNPIYVSDTLLYVGLSLALNAWWALALTPVLVWIMGVGVIAREEEYLERKFGNEYLRYKRQVRRWL
ncbi:MAG: isoprenylcysteine carboxylmethyltransferase family protein [Nitrospirota bacterium]